jgi:hypothetical protein
MLTSVGAVTESVAPPLTDPDVAVTVTSPIEAPLANPPVLMVATAGFDVLQETEFVIVAVDPSEYFPVAANCWLCPMGMAALVGATVRDCRIAAMTCRVALPRMVPDFAVMVAEPLRFAVASPV